MSRVAPRIDEPFDDDDRGSMHEARKRRIWERARGVCWLCTKPVPMLGAGVVYDHRNPLKVSGDDDDANIWPIHADPCNRLKTAADARARAKVNRVKKKHETPLSEIPGRGQIKGRKFDSPRRRFFEGKP